MGLIAWLATTGQIDRAKLEKAFAQPGALAFSVGAIGLTFVFAILRWWVLLRAIDLVIPLKTAAKLTFIGGFFNTFMPGAVGGDAFKMYYAVEHAPPGKRVEAATTVAMDRVVGLGAMFLLVGAAFVVPPLLGQSDSVFNRVADVLGSQMSGYWKLLGAAMALGIILLGASRHPGVRDWAIVERIRQRIPGAKYGGRIIDVFIQAVRSPWPLMLSILLSCASHLSTCSMFYVVGQAMGETSLGFARYVFLVPIGLIVNAIPGSPGGIGIGETAYGRLFAIALGLPLTDDGLKESPGVVLCIVWRFVTMGWNLVGGVVYVLHRRGEPDPALLKSEAVEGL